MTSYPVGVWTKDPDGYPAGSYLYNGPILFPAGINPDTTQTVVCVFGPAGGRANFPPLQAGTPGPPPVIGMGGVTTLPAGGAADADLIPVSPGGPGIASEYNLYLSIPQGAAGAAAANTLISPQPSDLTGTPTANYMIGYNPATSKAQWQPAPLLFLGNVPSSSISTTGTGAGQVRTLTYVTPPAQTRAYVPIVLASAVTTGTANTQIDIVARLGGAPNAQTGVQIGRGRGQIGAVTGTNPWSVNMIPDFANLISGGTQTVAIGATPTIYLNCEQMNNLTSDSYSTGAASFTVLGIPL